MKQTSEKTGDRETHREVAEECVVPLPDVPHACERFLDDLAEWAEECIARYGEAPATDVHDQCTFLTGLQPLLTHRHSPDLLVFFRRMRDRVRAHFADTGQWAHGYWRMQETHHGTEHFELFLGMLLQLDPDDLETRRQLIDAVEHVLAPVGGVECWFDETTGLFPSVYCGADGVRREEGPAINVPDHFRWVNLALLAEGAGGGKEYLQWAAAYARRWAEAICFTRELPIALAPGGPLYDLDATD